MAALVLLLLAVAGAGLAARLLSGPVWSEAFAGTVAARLEAALPPGAAVEVGVVGVALDGRVRPELHLRDTVISVPGRGTVSIDTAAVTAGWRGFGRRAEKIVVDHLALTLSVERQLPPLHAIAALVEQSLAAPRVRYLEVGSLTVFDAGADGDRATLMRDAALALGIGAEGRAEFSLAGRGAAGPWSIRADADPPGADGVRAVALRTEGLDVADVAGFVGRADAPVTGPIGFRGDLRLAGGAVADGEGELTLGPLDVAGEAATPFVGGRSRLEVLIRPGGRTVVLIPSPVLLPGGQVIVAGELGVPEPGGSIWPFDLRLSARGTTPQDERKGLADLAGSYDAAAGQLVVDRIRAAGEGASFAAAMRLGRADGRLAGALSGVFSSMSIDVLKAVWPTVIASDARRWVMEKVESGEISDATVDLTVLDRGIRPGAGSEAGAAVAFRFDGVAFRSFDDGPMIRDAVGSARLKDNRFEVTLESGRVDLGEDGSLPIASGRFVIPHVAVEPPTGEVDFRLSGDARATLALWNRLTLAGSRLPADTEGARGAMEAEVALRIPLVRGLRPEEVQYRADIRLTDLTLDQPVDGRTVSDADVEIRVEDGRARISGEALLDGVRAEVDLEESLDGQQGGAAEVRLRLEAEDRKRLGIGLEGVLMGPVTVDVSSMPGADGADGRQVTVDLADARLRILPLGIDKPRGRPGTARFTLVEGEGRTVIRDLELRAGEARISGSLTLDGDGRVVSADLPRIVAREGDRLSLTARRAADGVLDVEVRGATFNARRTIRGLLRGGAGPAAGTGSLRLDVAIGSVTGFAEESLSGFNLDAAVEDGRVAGLALTAQTAGSGSASLTLMAAGGGMRRLEAEAGEVGRLLRFLGIYRRVFGGRAVVTGTIDPTGGLRAAVDGSRLRIVDEPALARLSTAAESGPSAGRATVEIERLLFDLAFADGRLVIEDGVVRAATAGLSMQGDIDFSRETVRLSGTYLPASAFDSLLGKIPIIGQTMFAGGRAGLVGVTFRLAGPIDEPVLTVNPLSAIAPGIFRKLFELR